MTFSLVKLALEKSERDKQVAVGASDICNPCARCVADALLGVDWSSEYDMGAWVGTAIHLLVEKRIQKRHPDYMPEVRVTVGKIEGYGDVRSTSDLYIPDEKRVCDWKTTTRDKMDRLMRDLGAMDWLLEHPKEAVEQGSIKALGYGVQTHLYARGIENMLGEGSVEKITIGVIARDGQKKRRDIREVTFRYNPAVPDMWLGRAQAIWDYMDAGGDEEAIESAKGCYVCEKVRE